MQLWTDTTLLKIQNREIYDSIPIYATKADILRLEILAKFGGVYVDADSMCLAPVDALVKNEACFFATNHKGKIEINFMGCEKKNETMVHLVKKLPEYWIRITKKKDELDVYCIYRYIRKRLRRLEFTKIIRQYNCTVEEQTEATCIVQKMAHTWGENKRFRRIEK